MSRHCINLGNNDYETGVERVLALRAMQIASEDIVQTTKQIMSDNNFDAPYMNSREFNDILNETRLKRGPFLTEIVQQNTQQVVANNYPSYEASTNSLGRDTTTIPIPIDHGNHIPIFKKLMSLSNT